MADKRKTFLLRISPELWEQLNRWAAAELRSVNAQIEYLLREAVRKRSGALPDDAATEAGPRRHEETAEEKRNEPDDG